MPRSPLFRLPPALALALAMGLAWPALAETIPVATKLDAVTVFPTGAEIARVMQVDLPEGDHSLQIALPRGIQPDSIQIEGTSQNDLAISALDVIPAPPPDSSTENARVRALQEKLDALSAERRRYIKAADNAVFALELIRVLAVRKLQPEGKDTTPPVPDPSALTGLLDTVDGRLALISDSLLAAQAGTEAVDRQIAAIRAEIERAPAKVDPGWLASVHVLVRKPGTASFRLRYRIASASWQPLYEARLTTGAAEGGAQLELVRNAVVSQTTDEDWSDVALTLSTAQRSSVIAAPVLKPLSLDAFTDEIDQVEAAEAAGALAGLQGGGQATATTPGSVGRTEATSSSLGFNVLYAIPGRVSIDHSGASKTVRIGSSSSGAELFLRAVPKLDLTAYLGARFLADVETPLLPGRVMLFRDGILVGEARLSLTAQGDPITLSFGADDLVTIERREVDRRSGETGLVSTAYIEERSYLTRISSSHAFSIPITIEDQAPYSADDRIRVDILDGTTPSDLGEIEGRKGVYNWTKTLAPQVVQEIRFGFRVTWPKGVRR